MTRYDPHPQDYDDARTGPQASREAAAKVVQLCENRGEAGTRANGSRPLTHSSDLSREGLAVNATHVSFTPCIEWLGPSKGYQTKAAEALTTADWEPAHWAWIITTCGTEQCIEPAHLRVHAPVTLAYPYGICIYCGRRGSTKDHLLPRCWSGDTKRHFVVTVPACGTCNTLLNDTLTWSITERRAICHRRLEKHFRKILRTAEHSEDQLEEYGPTLRAFITESLDKKREVVKMLAWPEDPYYDLRAFEKSGIENPYAIGLVLPDDADLDAIVRAAA